ncbi:DivIVA domain-containing protein [Geoalkalibacter halelectricus]|uniref:DivIVA domain-containing protein n=1 Tax=Geoalkalibacter halelectricus TaxID=2847045 RepID=A0ABY5ZGR2_9BACT|nr:DivIVA domain-containing protein [Geoalkalibacter halelectricus]MDO3380168.1 DivIVA domain-containing protein [Geoalkalibacter halelectricus]UWZ78258.1 DivIVA domain-containing protein [Geoalkalibacter halelectricus]
MAITPIDIQQHQFKSQLFGYDKAGVDRFLELVAEELERLHRQSQELREELSRTRASLAEMREREEVLNATLLTAQKVTDDLRDNARKEAEVILADARVRGDQIVGEAEKRRLQLIDEIQDIKRQKVAFESGLRSLVESHLRLLNMDTLSLPPHKKPEELSSDRNSSEKFEDFSDLMTEDEQAGDDK